MTDDTYCFRHQHGSDYVLRGVLVAKAHREPEGDRAPYWADETKPHYTRFHDTGSLVWPNRADAESALALAVSERWPGVDFPVRGRSREEDA